MLDILIIVGDRVFHLPNPRDEGPWERGCIGGWHVRKYTERSNKLQVAGCRSGFHSCTTGMQEPFLL